MHQASVGFHCPECVKGGKQQVFRGPPVFDPIATKALIGINFLVFVWAVVQSGSISRLGRDVLLDFGLFGAPNFVDGVAAGEYYRIVTSAFLHNGIFHIGMNMYALWILGPQLEKVLDRQRFVTLYFVSMIGGATGVLLLDPTVPTVGASGAVFGLFGAVAVIQRAAGANIWASGIGQILAINLLFTFAVPQISVGGHLGGLIGGALVGLIYVQLAKAKQGSWVAVGAAVGLGVILLAAALSVASNPIF